MHLFHTRVDLDTTFFVISYLVDFINFLLRAPRTIIRYEVICVIGKSLGLSKNNLEQTSFKMTRTVRTRLVPHDKLTFDPFRIVTLNFIGRKTREPGYNAL